MGIRKVIITVTTN